MALFVVCYRDVEEAGYGFAYNPPYALQLLGSPPARVHCSASSRGSMHLIA